MLCPGCPRRLEETTRSGLSVWTCKDCDGCAVEIATLRAVVDRAQIDQLLLRARSPGAAWGKPCSRCTKRGREARVRDARRLYVLDWCEPCEVLWFDVEELEGFVPRAEEPVAPPAPPIEQQTGQPAEPPPHKKAADKPAERAAKRSKRKTRKRKEPGKKAARDTPKADRRRKAGFAASSADIVAELVGDVGVEALLAILSGIVD